MTSAVLGGNAGAGKMVKASHPVVETQEFLSAFSPLECLLTSWAERTRLVRPAHFAFIAVSMTGPAHYVAAGCGDHLPVVDVSQTQELPERGSILPELIYRNDFWTSYSTGSMNRKVFAALTF